MNAGRHVESTTNIYQIRVEGDREPTVIKNLTPLFNEMFFPIQPPSCLAIQDHTEGITAAKLFLLHKHSGLASHRRYCMFPIDTTIMLLRNCSNILNEYFVAINEVV